MILKSVIQCHAVKVATVTSNIERPTSNIEKNGESPHYFLLTIPVGEGV